MNIQVTGEGDTRIVTVTDDTGSRQIDERMAYQHARADQGYEGTYADWLLLAADEREAYELGAAGIGN